MSGIFISYRRADSEGFAGSLLREFNQRLPTDEVFMDIEDIEGGVDFTVALEQALNSCHVFIVLIGPQWLDITDRHGNRRLDNPHDWVRLEVAHALASDARVIPLLVKGTSMPPASVLPTDLAALSKRNAMEISNEDWAHDVDKLCKVIRKAIGLVNVTVDGHTHPVRFHEVLEMRPVTRCGQCSTCLRIPTSSAGSCPFCGEALQEAESVEALRPTAELAFTVDREAAHRALSDWAGDCWLAPRAWKAQVRDNKTLSAVFLPFWRFSCETEGAYEGRRGIWIEVPATRVVERGGKSVVESATRTDTTWSAASGRFQKRFDDLLIAGCKALPAEELESLEPWGLGRLTLYAEDRENAVWEATCEEDLPTAYSRAIERIRRDIHEVVRRHIGGDEQEIDSVSPIYRNASADLVLMPVYLRSYRYKANSFRVLVNARTGAVQGEAPPSLGKRILILVLGTLLLAALAVGAGMLLF